MTHMCDTYFMTQDHSHSTTLDVPHQEYHTQTGSTTPEIRYKSEVKSQNLIVYIFIMINMDFVIMYYD